MSSNSLGHHRGWILPMQSMVMVCLAALALIDPQALFGSAMWLLLGTLLLINLAAATQDVATDGLAVRLLPERWRGLGNSLQVGGYKLGMLASGSGLLLLVGYLGWNVSLGLLAAGLLVLTLPIAWFPEKKLLPFQAARAEAPGAGLLLRHYKGLLAQPGMMAWLVVVLTFKLGDALGSPMIKPMLVDQGWDASALGQLTLISSLAGIGGALLGGMLYARWDAMRSLLVFGMAQAAGLAAMAVLIGRGSEVGLVYAVALFEQGADGMSTVALFAVMMSRCRPEHEGADFTLQASAQLLLSGLVGACSGFLAKTVGYGGLFLGAALLGLAMLVWVPRYFKRQVQTGH
jgi:predicted MFS family arabinose efflux permease